MKQIFKNICHAKTKENKSAGTSLKIYFKRKTVIGARARRPRMRSQVGLKKHHYKQS